MLTIRKVQMEAFRDHSVKGFEDRMVAHLQKFFPKACQMQTEAEIRETIRYGLDRAKAYDIDSQQDVCKYIDLMYTFGTDFDMDPELRWASKILNGNRQAKTVNKMDLLFKKALKQIKLKEA